MDKKIVKMKLVNWVDFETPISIDETKSLHDDFMFKVDEVFCDVFNKNCRGYTRLIYYGEEDD